MYADVLYCMLCILCYVFCVMCTELCPVCINKPVMYADIMMLPLLWLISTNTTITRKNMVSIWWTTMKIKMCVIIYFFKYNEIDHVTCKLNYSNIWYSWLWEITVVASMTQCINNKNNSNELVIVVIVFVGCC